MDIRLDRDSEIPLGVQLAWHLKAGIVQGELAAGARLPSVREMAAETGVNANTVRAVYARLEAEGLLETHHGRGTFVVEGAEGSDELGAIAARAARDAAAAGVDPRAVAAISHVPYLLSVGLVNAVDGLRDEHARQLAASGYRSMTRLAGSDLRMWSDIVATNRTAIVEMLDCCQREIEAMRTAIAMGEEATWQRLMETAFEAKQRA